MLRNGAYTTGSLLDFSYHQSFYKLISIDLSRQTKTIIPWQVNFIGKSAEGNSAKMLFITGKQGKKQFQIFL